MRYSSTPLALLVLFGAACGGPSGPIEVIPALYQANQALKDLNDGDVASLEYPPQGGHVLFVGAWLKNVAEAKVTLRANLRTPEGQIVATDLRTLAYAPAQATPQLLGPDLRSYLNVANIPVCPGYLPFDLYGHPFVVELEVTEPGSRRVGRAVRAIVPDCLQPEGREREHCRCECAANYQLGKCPR